MTGTGRRRSARGRSGLLRAVTGARGSLLLAPPERGERARPGEFGTAGDEQE